MLYRGLCLVLLLALCTVATARADTFTLDMPLLTGDYSAGTSVVYRFDFGFEFSQIDSASIEWAGELIDGTCYTFEPDGTITYSNFPGFFEARLYGLDGESAKSAFVTDSPGSFDTLTTFTDGSEAPSWLFLMDGIARVQTVLDYSPPDGIVNPGNGFPGGTLTRATLVVEGIAAPEPGALTTLLCALTGTAGLMWRRRAS